MDSLLSKLYNRSSIYTHVLQHCTSHHHTISFPTHPSHLTYLLLYSKIMKNKFIKVCENKLKTMKSKSIVIPCTSSFCEGCCEKVAWGFKKENEAIPKDVPRGHLVVYVGDDHKRFVIKMSLLKHPIFKALLDQAQDAYDFSSDTSRLWIPCDENTFLDVVRCSGAPQHQRKCIGMYM
ncbi:auxin-responsive protein SAUR50 [Brassica napus]|nr:auxin-responsive protein SAUR50 [Brassica napus]